MNEFVEFAVKTIVFRRNAQPSPLIRRPAFAVPEYPHALHHLGIAGDHVYIGNGIVVQRLAVHPLERLEYGTKNRLRTFASETHQPPIELCKRESVSAAQVNRKIAGEAAIMEKLHRLREKLATYPVFAGQCIRFDDKLGEFVFLSWHIEIQFPLNCFEAELVERGGIVYGRIRQDHEVEDANVFMISTVQQRAYSIFESPACFAGQTQDQFGVGMNATAAITVAQFLKVLVANILALHGRQYIHIHTLHRECGAHQHFTIGEDLAYFEHAIVRLFREIHTKLLRIAVPDAGGGEAAGNFHIPRKNPKIRVTNENIRHMLPSEIFDIRVDLSVRKHPDFAHRGRAPIAERTGIRAAAVSLPERVKSDVAFVAEIDRVLKIAPQVGAI